MLNVFIHLLLSICRRGINSLLAACAVPPQLLGQCLRFLFVTICHVYAQYIYINIVGSSIAANGLLHITRSATHAASKFRKSIRKAVSLCIHRAYLGMGFVVWTGKRCLTAQALLSKNMVNFCFLHSTDVQVIVKWFLASLCVITVCISMHLRVRQFLGDLMEILAYPGLIFWIPFVIFIVMASKQQPHVWSPSTNTKESSIRPRTWNQRRQ